MTLCLFCRKFVKVKKVKCRPKCEGKIFPHFFVFTLCLREKLVFCFADIVVKMHNITDEETQSHNQKIFAISNGHQFDSIRFLISNWNSLRRVGSRVSSKEFLFSIFMFHEFKQSHSVCLTLPSHLCLFLRSMWGKSSAITARRLCIFVGQHKCESNHAVSYVSIKIYFHPIERLLRVDIHINRYSRIHWYGMNEKSENTLYACV